MPSQITNLDELTSKIYQDGVEKAHQRSEELLKETKVEADQMIKRAKEEADKILATAKREADRYHKSSENELHLKSKQLLSDLKREIRELIAHKILDENLKTAFSDLKFLETIIIEAMGYWKESKHMALTLPEELRSKIDKGFEQRIAKSVDDLTITFNGQLKGGFRVKREKDAYEITFSEEDFHTLFQSYLSTKTNRLFEE